MPLILETHDFKQEHQDFGYTLARLVGRNGAMLTPDDVSAVAVFVKDETDPQASIDQFASQFVYYGSITPVSSVVLATPQRDLIWTLPDEGYNFAHYLTRDLVFSAMDEVGGHTYCLEYRIHATTTNGSGIQWVRRKVFSSPVNAPDT